MTPLLQKLPLLLALVAVLSCELVLANSEEGAAPTQNSESSKGEKKDKPPSQDGVTQAKEAETPRRDEAQAQSTAQGSPSTADSIPKHTAPQDRGSTKSTTNDAKPVTANSEPGSSGTIASEGSSAKAGVPAVEKSAAAVTSTPVNAAQPRQAKLVKQVRRSNGIQPSGSLAPEIPGNRAPATARQQTGPSVVLLIDTSRSAAALAIQIQTEGYDLLRAMPDGAYVSIMSVAGSVTKIFDGVLGPNSRPMAVKALMAVSSRGWHTDLGAALSEASKALAAGLGDKRVYLFTDGEPLPPKESPFRGRTFQQLLQEPAISGDVDWNIRLFGETELQSSVPNVTIWRYAPSWSAHKPITHSESPGTPVEPIEQKPSLTAWRNAGIASVAVLILLGALYAVNRRLQSQNKESERIRREMLRPARKTLELVGEQPAESYLDRVIVLSAESGETASLEEGVELVVGDRYDALIHLNSEGGSMSLGMSRGGVVLKNCGTAPVFVGEHLVPPRSQQWLERRRYEVAVGRHLVYLIPERVVVRHGHTTEDETPGPKRLRHMATRRG